MCVARIDNDRTPMLYGPDSLDGEFYMGWVGFGRPRQIRSTTTSQGNVRAPYDGTWMAGKVKIDQGEGGGADTNLENV